ncbi:MAG TPA: TolC family protein [Phycisphaerales bacterium]|nr:TolC family protein [Phycisphaerales bacterium]
MKHARHVLLTPLLALLPACSSPFDQSKEELAMLRERLEVIHGSSLEEKSISKPVTPEEAGDQMLAEMKARLAGASTQPAAASVNLSLADVRAASLSNNLDLKVDFLNPAIAQAQTDAERAKFEATFTAAARRIITDAPTALGTEGSQALTDIYDVGVNLPLRTGGTASVSAPLNDTRTNNPFSLLNPAYEADLQFSITQPLLRNAGVETSEYSIYIAQQQENVTWAETKLEAIRILADADKAYWFLYAARRELVVRQQQYDLALSQLEQARHRVAAGDLAEIEIRRAESGAASQLQQIIVADTNVKRAQRDLKRILHRDDLPINGPTEILTMTEPSPLGLDLDGNALAIEAIANRMEMLELELQLAMDASTIRFQKNQALPLVVLDYTYTINGLGSSYGRATDSWPDRSFEDHNVGIRAEIPIGNEAAEARVQEAIMRRLQRLATRSQRESSIRQEVFDALDQLQQAWQSILAARQETVLAARTLEGERRQFDLGLRTSTDVLLASANLADAQSREVQALSDYETAKIDIAFATGTLLGQSNIRWETYASDPPPAPPARQE